MQNSMGEIDRLKEHIISTPSLKTEIVSSGTELEEKVAYLGLIEEITSIISNDQSETRTLLQQGFLGLISQQNKLFEQNEDLKDQLQEMQEQLEFVHQQLHKKNNEERLAKEKRLKRKNRKRLSRREPITREVYNFLISEANALSYSNSYRGARLRLALALLLVTGIRIGELLSLRMSQVKTLFEKSWIAIDRQKRGPSNHKAFLTKEGTQILKDRWEDFQFLSHWKKSDSYIFTGESSEEPLKLEAFNRIINQFLKQSAAKLERNPKLRSHSFRIGFITQLWRDTNDIEFVRQAIGHTILTTTSRYVEILPEKERQQRILTIENNNPLDPLE